MLKERPAVAVAGRAGRRQIERKRRKRRGGEEDTNEEENEAEATKHTNYISLSKCIFNPNSK